MDNSFSSLIGSASSILIMLPTKPYFDQVSAALGLYLSLRSQKEVNIFCPSQMTVGFNRLVGVDQITSELGSKNLEIRFADYDAANIEKVSYDIENGEFKLKIVPKTGFSSPKKDQVITNYSGVSADLVILVGGASESHFPTLNSQDLAKGKVAHIGTQAISVEQERPIMSFARPASSTSEIVSGLIKDSGLLMDADIATDLLAGIEEASGHFESSETTAETFDSLAYLLRSGGRRSQTQKLSPSAFPQGSVPQKPFMVKEQKPKGTAKAPKDWLEPKIFKGTSVN
ncbi:bifunctional oligoribonuclease/PAP phosphatase NrnA [Patescibacteria group bacterium]